MPIWVIAHILKAWRKNLKHGPINGMVARHQHGPLYIFKSYHPKDMKGKVGFGLQALICSHLYKIM